MFRDIESKICTCAMARKYFSNIFDKMEFIQ